jgi:hypothetical protein
MVFDDLFDDLDDLLGHVAASGTRRRLALTRTPRPVRFLPGGHQRDQAAAGAARGAAGGQALIKLVKAVTQLHGGQLASALQGRQAVGVAVEVGVVDDGDDVRKPAAARARGRRLRLRVVPVVVAEVLQGRAPRTARADAP